MRLIDADSMITKLKNTYTKKRTRSAGIRNKHRGKRNSRLPYRCDKRYAGRESNKTRSGAKMEENERTLEYADQDTMMSAT